MKHIKTFEAFINESVVNEKKITVITYGNKKSKYTDKDIKEFIKDFDSIIDSDNLPAWLYKAGMSGNPNFPKKKKDVIVLLDKILKSKSDVTINVDSSKPSYKNSIVFEAFVNENFRKGKTVTDKDFTKHIGKKVKGFYILNVDDIESFQVQFEDGQYIEVTATANEPHGSASIVLESESIVQEGKNSIVFEASVNEGLNNSYMDNQIKDAIKSHHGKHEFPKFIKLLETMDKDSVKIILDALDEFGQFKYSDGYDEGYDEGKNNGQDY